MKSGSKQVRQLQKEGGKFTLNRDGVSDVRRLGKILEVDLIVSDTHIVSSINKDLIGRPKIYIVKDIYSQMITGVHIDLEEPSWMGIMLALRNTLEDKAEFCREFAINILENKWPNSFLTEFILTREYKVEKYQYDNLEKLGIGVIVKPEYAPYSKGLIERTFSLLNTKINYESKKKVDLEKERRSDLDSLLTLEEFKMVIMPSVKCVFFEITGYA